MRYLFIFLLLIPLTTALNITAEYSDSASFSEEIKFNICVLNSTDIYDLKIDIFQNDKRISRILNDDVWISSIYYLKDAISKCSKFYIKINEGVTGKAEIIFKLRDSKNRVSIFSPYFIDLTDDDVIVKNIVKEDKKDETESINEKNINFSYAPKENIIPETIILSPKAFNTTNNSKKLYTDYGKYSFVLFCLIISILYTTKPKKKENEFR